MQLGWEPTCRARVFAPDVIHPRKYVFCRDGIIEVADVALDVGALDPHQRGFRALVLHQMRLSR